MQPKVLTKLLGNSKPALLSLHRRPVRVNRNFVALSTLAVRRLVTGCTALGHFFHLLDSSSLRGFLDTSFDLGRHAVQGNLLLDSHYLSAGIEAHVFAVTIHDHFGFVRRCSIFAFLSETLNRGAYALLLNSLLHGRRQVLHLNSLLGRTRCECGKQQG